MRCGCSGSGTCGCSIVSDPDEGGGLVVKGTGDPKTPYKLALDIKSAKDSDCIALSGAGTVKKPLKAVPIISNEADNQLQCTAKGLYVPPRNEESDPEPEDVVQAAGLMGTNRFNVPTGKWTRVIGLRPDPRFPTSGTEVSNSGAILQAKVEGYFDVTGTIQFLGEGGEGRRGLAFDTSQDPGAPVNTKTLTYANFGAVDGPDPDLYVNGSAPLHVPANHYIRMWIYQDSGRQFRASGNNFTWVRAVKRK